MGNPRKSEQDHIEEARAALIEAALPHVPFDGWSDQTIKAATEDAGLPPDLVHLACPRGVIDLALASHRAGDKLMKQRAAEIDLSRMRYSARVAELVKLRIECAGELEVVRRGVTFFSLPVNSSEGAAAIWNTCDLIWKTLGDTSDDINWYSKRVILSAVYSSTLLYWLGDESEDHQDTWAFLDRRIGNVMQFEKFKAGLRDNPLFKGVMRGPGRVLNKIKAPGESIRTDLPGRWKIKEKEENE